MENVWVSGSLCSFVMTCGPQFPQAWSEVRWAGTGPHFAKAWVRGSKLALGVASSARVSLCMPI